MKNYNINQDFVELNQEDTLRVEGGVGQVVVELFKGYVKSECANSTVQVVKEVIKQIANNDFTPSAKYADNVYMNSMTGRN